jgi:hypothetical protein
MMSGEVLVGPQCRAGLAPTVTMIRYDDGSGSELGLVCSGAVGGDGGVAGLAGGDDRMEVAQDRGGDHGLGLGRLELVVLPGGQVPVTGAVDGVGALGSPDRAPGSHPESWPSLPGEFGATDEGARELLPRW